MQPPDKIEGNRSYLQMGRDFCLGFVWILIPALSSAQIPPGDFQSLEVLPRDIDRKELIEQMKSFTRALGVRCQHCHVGEEGAPLSTFDFASNEKETKNTARTMMRMTEEINHRFLATVRSGAAQVQCVTCHRGAPRPRQLHDVLIEAIEGGGSAAAIQKYRELRKEYFGSALFDFRPETLNRVARDRALAGKHGEARQLLDLNLEFFPEEVSTLLLYGDVLLKIDDSAGARASFQKVLEIDPENAVARRRIEGFQER